MYFHNHYQQFFKIFSCNLLILLLLFWLQNIQVKGQYLNWDSIKDLKIILLSSADKKLCILERTLNFLFAFKQILFTCLSNVKSLSLVIPRSSTFLLSQILLFPMLKNISSLWWPETSRWHFSLFNFMEYVSNQVRAAEFSSSLFIKVILRSRLQTKEVVSSAKLQTSISLRAKNKSFK